MKPSERKRTLLLATVAISAASSSAATKTYVTADTPGFFKDAATGCPQILVFDVRQPGVKGGGVDMMPGTA